MTSRPNLMRGETSFTVAGKSLLLRPTFEALVAAEEELGSLFARVERASQGALTINEIAAMLWHSMPVEDRPDRDTVGRAVVEAGLVEASKPLRAIFTQVLKGSG